MSLPMSWYSLFTPCSGNSRGYEKTVSPEKHIAQSVRLKVSIFGSASHEPMLRKRLSVQKTNFSAKPTRRIQALHILMGVGLTWSNVELTGSARPYRAAHLGAQCYGMIGNTRAVSFAALRI